MANSIAVAAPVGTLNTKKFWQSSNFWTNIVLLIGALFVGFPEDAGQEIVLQLFALISGGQMLRNFFKKEGTFDWKQVTTVNFWNYLAAIILSITQLNLPPEFFDGLREVVEGIINKDWQVVVRAVFSIATMLYYIFVQKKTPSDAVKQAKAIG